MTSPQMLIQLRRFNTVAANKLAARGAAGAAAARGRIAGTGTGGGPTPLNPDLGSVLGTPTSDRTEIDTSVIGERGAGGRGGKRAGAGSSCAGAAADGFARIQKRLLVGAAGAEARRLLGESRFCFAGAPGHN
jgi:hypothetical protein